MAARSFFAVVVIKGDNAVDVGAGKVECLGNGRDDLAGDIPEFPQNAIQDRQKRTFLLLPPINYRHYRRDHLGTGWLHAQRLPSFACSGYEIPDPYNDQYSISVAR